jgi:hypothetical protein
VGHGGPQTYTLPKFVVSSFGWSPPVPTEGIITDCISCFWQKKAIWITVIPWNNVADNHKVKVSHNRSKGFRVGEGLGFLDVRHYEGGRSSALRTSRLYPRRNPWYSFLVAESTPGHMVLSVATEKIPSDTIGNRSRERPTSGALP